MRMMTIKDSSADGAAAARAQTADDRLARVTTALIFIGETESFPDMPVFTTRNFRKYRIIK